MTDQLVESVQGGSSPVTKVPALELREISASYGATRVLRSVSLTVQPGSVTALIGPNGAGKTTSLRVASGLMKPSAGQVLLNGKEITHSSASRRAKNGMCHVPEGRGIYRNLTV